LEIILPESTKIVFYNELTNQQQNMFITFCKPKKAGRTSTGFFSTLEHVIFE